MRVVSSSSARVGRALDVERGTLYTAEHTLEVCFENMDDIFERHSPVCVTSPPFKAVRAWRLRFFTNENDAAVCLWTEDDRSELPCELAELPEVTINGTRVCETEARAGRLTYTFARGAMLASRMWERNPVELKAVVREVSTSAAARVVSAR